MGQVVNNNQQANNHANALVFYMSYLGYTYEDGVVISESFARAKTAQVGDKIIYPWGEKGTISLILPDNKMPRRGSDGKIADMLVNPALIINRKYIAYN